MNHLEAERLSFTYPHPTGAPAFQLANVTATVPRGSITGLLGPNGGGKSTLLRVLAGVVTPATGRVLLDGQPLTALTRKEAARRIALVPQATHPAFDYTVMEMVLMGRHPHLRMFQLEGPDDLQIADAAMVATSTTVLADRSFLTLSGGEQQRVALASALAQSPELLLLDEPTASLDLGVQLDTAALLRRVNREQGVTMVVATHDLQLAASLCDRLVLIRAGSVLDEGPLHDVLTPASIRRVYDVEADVTRHGPTDRLVVIPRRRVS